MSFKKNIEIKCPKCTEKQNFEVWQLINVTEYPDLKSDIFNQDIFKFTCDKCRESGIILYPLIQKIGYEIDRNFKKNNILTKYF